MKLYAILLVSTVLLVYAASHNKRLNFRKRWMSAIITATIVSVPFIIWDIHFTNLGIWGFTEKYLIVLYFFNLPIEEVLFFFVVPIACLLIYESVKYLKFRIKISSELIITSSVVSFILAILSVGGIYTTFVLGIYSFVSVLIYTWNDNRRSVFIFTYIATLIPFLIFNSLLTKGVNGTPVVWYNPNEITNIRVGSIPIEDFLYQFVLLFTTVTVYEHLKNKK